MTERENQIYAFLKSSHIGKDNAVFSKVLEDAFGIGGRDVRRAVGALRREGIPICSNEKGYFLPMEQTEINRTVRRLGGLASSISDTKTGLIIASAISQSETQ